MFTQLKPVCAALLLATGASAVNANVLITEYVEGSSNNKAIEITNLGTESVTLDDYALNVFFNGNTSAGASIQLSGSLSAGTSYVLAHSSADAAILDVANQTYGGGLFNGDDAITLTKSDTIIDSIGQLGVDPGSEWGNDLTSTKDNTIRRKNNVQSGRTDATADFDPANEWDGFEKNDFSDLGQYQGGDNDNTPPVSEIGSCGDSATLISEIQGNQAETTLKGSELNVEAIVTANFTAADSLKGFYLQEEVSDQDGDSTTSEGIFVYTGSNAPELAVGDIVRVRAKAGEFYNQTQLSSVKEFVNCGSADEALVSTNIMLPAATADAMESVEGMLVTFNEPLFVTENYNLSRYGEFVVSANDRLYVPTAIAKPGADAIAQQAQNNLNRLIVDDASTKQNPTVIPYPAPELSAHNTLRSGDKVINLTGVVGYSFNQYRLHPTQTPTFESANPRTGVPTLPGVGSLKIASFNVLNFFNGDGQGGGFPTPRGADNADELERQKQKIVSAILAMDSDIIGLMEIENDGYGEFSAIVELVDALNLAYGSDVYGFVNPGLEQLGSDAIAVGFIYRTDKVSEAGSAATLSSYPFDDKNRQPLAQTFLELASDEHITLVVNHFKSKGSCPKDGSANDDSGDGQGCWNEKRTEASNAIVDWLATQPTGVETDNQMIMGDLNAYAKEDPIKAIEDRGFTNLIADKLGEKTYSFVFYGQSGYLDHALSSEALTPNVTGIKEWHINADEPRALDYNTEYKTDLQKVNLYDAGPYRASDHDPVIIELNLSGSHLNQAPEADFDVYRFWFVHLFVSKSSDEDGQIVESKWSFNDDFTAVGPLVLRFFWWNAESATLTVKDDKGSESSKTVNL
ncbi:ExeM/NucH family extracellular endonuclease [Pleionea sp. CnH1-48]|uniref:ExeM/NucH family extracellular endonuclease n=1 Tax=Pleionea sp. CnH1-48 TaxID=2954494 RepID=UPI00209712BE|nr:ExeM/NucH family extracellular endonuclease [Pleionea sp. CnH1-48]MCO7226699.1 ExeM/NucH family extracellular endonuclease [Pleionea sp. CnH1-48]